MEKSNRINYLDIVKGIAIILMVIGHIIPSKSIINSIIYSFHMPLFIIVSGYFYKEKNLREILQKMIKQFWLPYIISIIFVYLIKSIINNNFDIIFLLKYTLLGVSKKKLFSLSELGALWYIPFFIVINILFWIIKKISKNNDLKLLFLVAICFFLGLILGYKKIYLPWSIDVAMTCILFYYIGYILNKYNLLNYIIYNKIFIACMLFVYLLTFNFGNIEIAIRKYPFGLICFMNSISGCMIIFLISNIIDKFLKKTSTILAWYGKYSIYILIFHYIETRLFNYKLFKNNISIILILRLSIITISLLCYLFLKKKITSTLKNQSNNRLTTIILIK